MSWLRDEPSALREAVGLLSATGVLASSASLVAKIVFRASPIFVFSSLLTPPLNPARIAAALLWGLNGLIAAAAICGPLFALFTFIVAYVAAILTRAEERASAAVGLANASPLVGALASLIRWPAALLLLLRTPGGWTFYGFDMPLARQLEHLRRVFSYAPVKFLYASFGLTDAAAQAALSSNGATISVFDGNRHIKPTLRALDERVLVALDQIDDYPAKPIPFHGVPAQSEVSIVPFVFALHCARFARSPSITMTWGGPTGLLHVRSMRPYNPGSALALLDHFSIVSFLALLSSPWPCALFSGFWLKGQWANIPVPSNNGTPSVSSRIDNLAPYQAALRGDWPIVPLTIRAHYGGIYVSWGGEVIVHRRVFRRFL